MRRVPVCLAANSRTDFDDLTTFGDMCQIVVDASPFVAAVSEGYEQCGLRISDGMSRREKDPGEKLGQTKLTAA